MNDWILKLTFFAWCIFPFVNLHAQDEPIPSHVWKEAGLPYIQNFSPKDYKADPQNWKIAQDERGIMYFGNTEGLLVYDGVSWRLLKTANKTVVRRRHWHWDKPERSTTHNGSVRFANFGVGTLQTDANGNVSVSSDIRLKNVKGDFERGLTEILALKPINYTWKEETGLDTENIYAGFSAQNVQQAIPEAVGTDQKGYLTRCPTGRS